MGRMPEWCDRMDAKEHQTVETARRDDLNAVTGNGALTALDRTVWKGDRREIQGADPCLPRSEAGMDSARSADARLSATRTRNAC